jgi:hypothetical protein
MRSKEKVARVATSGIVAMVTDDLPVGNFTIAQFVSNTMGFMVPPLYRELTIAVPVCAGFPLPTLIWVFGGCYFTPKSVR